MAEGPGPKAWGGRLGVAIVIAALLALFLSPQEYFIPVTFLATGTMVVVADLARGTARIPRPSPFQLAVGVVSAVVLYGVFFLGAVSIREFQPFGITPGQENSVYGLIASPANPLVLQVAVIGLDAAGYEGYFRGTLQRRLQGRYGFVAVFAVAALDAGLHIVSLYRYPGFGTLWVATTFVADTAWGITYYFGRGVWASGASHFLWDLSIFVIHPLT